MMNKSLPRFNVGVTFHHLDYYNYNYNLSITLKCKGSIISVVFFVFYNIAENTMNRYNLGEISF
jgi:hypothetical protein